MGHLLPVMIADPEAQEKRRVPSRLRRLVARSFTPRAADRHHAVMRSLVDELLDDFAGDGYCEFMADFADRYPGPGDL